MHRANVNGGLMYFRSRGGGSLNYVRGGRDGGNSVDKYTRKCVPRKNSSTRKRTCKVKGRGAR